MTASLAVTSAAKSRPGDGLSRPSGWRPPRVSPAALLAVTLAHAALLGLLLSLASAVEPVTPPRPLTVSLIEPEIETPEPAPVEPPPVAPRPVKKPVPPPPVLVAKPKPVPVPEPELVPEPKQAPEPEPVPEPEPEPEPVPEPVPEPAPTPAPAPAPKPRPVREAPPPAPTPPRAAAYLNNPRPAYPALSRRLGEEGVVRLNILVNPDGSVARLELAKSSGHPRLDRSAMDTVASRWKFEPARQGGKPVAAWVIVPIQFTLRS